jgi:hypothetical protein
MAFEQAVALWLAYVSRALISTDGMPRLLVHYEAHFERPRDTAERLAAFAGRDGALEDAGEALEQLIDPGLWRNRTARERVIGDPRLPAEAACLYLLSDASGEER